MIEEGGEIGRRQPRIEELLLLKPWLRGCALGTLKRIRVGLRRGAWNRGADHCPKGLGGLKKESGYFL